MYDTDLPSVRFYLGTHGIHNNQPKPIEFPAKYSYDTAERRIFALVLPWASTVHKMQGSTADYIVVHLRPKIFVVRALSRVRSIDGLRIEELYCANRKKLVALLH